MIRITINADQDLDLNPETSIRFEFNSPLFDWEFIPGDLSYPFEIPLTDRNKQLLQFPHILQKSGHQTSLNCVVWVNGVRFLTGQMKIHKVNNWTASVYVVSAAGDFAQLIKEKRLDEVDLGGDRSLIGVGLLSYMDSTLAGNWPDQDLTFYPVRNLGFPTYPELDSIWDGVMNWYYNSGFAEPNHPSGDPEYHLAANVFSPYPYLLYLMDQVFSDHGYSMSGPFTVDSEIQKLTVHSLRTGLYGAEAPDVVTTKTYKYPTAINLQDYVPPLSIAELLISIRKMFCLSYQFDNLTNTVTIVPVSSVLASGEADDWTGITNPAYNINQEDSQLYRLEFELDQSDEELEKVQSVDRVQLLDPVTSVGSLPGGEPHGVVRLVQDEGAFYTYLENGWVFFGYNLAPYGQPDAAVKIPTKAHPLTMIEYQDDLPVLAGGSSRTWRIPHLNQEGEYMMFLRSELEDYGFRMAFFHGMYNDSQGNAYPYASADPYDPDGTKIGSYSLGWHGPDGLYEKWWKPWITWQQSTKKVTRTIYLDAQMLQEMDINKKKRIDGVNYLIRKVTVLVSMNDIQPAQVELYKV